MASTKVGDGLSYQAAVRWAIGRCFCNESAARVVQEKRPSRTGVVRAMARSDHWRWVYTPRWVRTSWKVTSSCQRRTNHSRIWVGSAAGSVHSKAWVSEGALGIADQHPANEDGRFAGAVPDRRLGGEFHRAGGAVIPGHCGTGPRHVGLVKEGFQRGSPRAFQRRGARSDPVDEAARTHRRPRPAAIWR